MAVVRKRIWESCLGWLEKSVIEWVIEPLSLKSVIALVFSYLKNVARCVQYRTCDHFPWLGCPGADQGWIQIRSSNCSKGSGHDQDNPAQFRWHLCRLKAQYIGVQIMEISTCSLTKSKVRLPQLAAHDKWSESRYAYIVTITVW